MYLYDILAPLYTYFVNSFIIQAFLIFYGWFKVNLI